MPVVFVHGVNTRKGPAYDAIFTIASDMGSAISIGGAPLPAQDGNTWVTVQ